MPKLEKLFLGYNGGLDSQGITALAAPLRMQPALKSLVVPGCEIGDEGVASLFANLGKDDFKALEYLDLSQNGHMTDKVCAFLVAALDSDTLPRLCQIHVCHFAWSSAEGGSAALKAVDDALARAAGRRLARAS